MPTKIKKNKRCLGGSYVKKIKGGLNKTYVETHLENPKNYNNLKTLKELIKSKCIESVESEDQTKTYYYIKDIDNKDIPYIEDFNLDPIEYDNAILLGYDIFHKDEMYKAIERSILHPTTGEPMKPKDIFRIAFYDILKNATENRSYDSEETLKKFTNFIENFKLKNKLEELRIPAQIRELEELKYNYNVIVLFLCFLIKFFETLKKQTLVEINTINKLVNDIFNMKLDILNISLTINKLVNDIFNISNFIFEFIIIYVKISYGFEEKFLEIVTFVIDIINRSKEEHDNLFVNYEALNEIKDKLNNIPNNKKNSRNIFIQEYYKFSKNYVKFFKNYVKLIHNFLKIYYIFYIYSLSFMNNTRKDNNKLKKK